MAIDNLISVEFSAQELKTIDDAIGAILGVIQSKAVNLTPEERRQYGRIADKNKVLVDKCKLYMEQDPSTVPPTIDKAEFDKDYLARTQLEAPLKKLDRVIEMMTDTKTLLDYDNYTAAVSYYRYVKFLATQNQAGTTSIYKDLSTHYQTRAAATSGTTNTKDEENKA
ncbi:hypothetical protein J5295_08190 [Riemerella anatipestifer]|uniref:Uncharacterized protein n=1 Tax=Riemerella anatipestifer TaxID=34085 RepID=A0AAP3AKG2_RIEAN|nr:hypothetical protein [Riemerella anatipestifer]AZZ59040.1 hypothetical protein AWB57_08380 [Riemerella anatipestifer]MBT0526627.1 hypothetical protein [Riemerella anatipestifer]MBT0528612.1 hypothetical protein [Riemerella anatipestifer]MBT0530451.1 hypothetical protein [Riemerella anatipestifer]MBT0532451.1 hypothetical protein [Riemerella anatipestifer]